MTTKIATADTFALEANIVRTTEKAILVRCFSIRGDHDVWFPKSQIEIGNFYIYGPAWLAAAKSRDCGRSLGLTNYDVARAADAERLAA